MIGRRFLFARRYHDPPQAALILVGPAGVTLWRDGAVSLQWRGHFLQIVLGDWWGPWREPPPRR